MSEVQAAFVVQTVGEQVVDGLRQLILEGDFLPGDKLQQDELAARLGVSAMPVREGLRQLQAEGLVDFVPRRGAFVASLTADEFDELYHMREGLESLALRWAIPRLNPQIMETLRQTLHNVEETEQRGDVRRRTLLVRTFLWTIFEAAGRRHLFDAIRRYYRMTYLYQRQYSAMLELSAQRAQIYRRLLDAIAAGNVDDAIAAYREHYRLIRETMLPYLRK